MIKPISITIEGFGSIQEPTTLKFKTKGLIVVKGENGVGKTTIFSALSWCWYGKTLKNKPTISTWEDLRLPTYKGTMVSVKHRDNEDTWEIIRCKDYRGRIGEIMGKDRVFIFKNGELIPEGRGKRDHNAYIVSILGLSHDLFKTSILFGQKMKRLIEEDGPNKKKLLEEAFELAYINKAKDLSELKRNKLADELRETNQQIALREKEKETIGTVIDNINVLKEEFRLKQEKRISFFKNELKELKRSREAILSQFPEPDDLLGKNLKRQAKIKNEIQSLNASLLDLNKIQYQYETRLARKTSLQKEITEADYNLSIVQKNNATCPTCGGPLKDEKKNLLIEEYTLTINTNKQSIDILNGQLLGYKKQLSSASKLQSSINSLETKLNKILEAEKAITKAQSQLQSVDKDVERLRSAIKSAKEEKSGLDVKKLRDSLKRLEEELMPLEDTRDKLQKDYDTYNWIIQVPLSNSGLKAFIFNQMMQSLNKSLAYYSSFVGFRPEFEVDLNSARKDINIVVYRKGKVPVAYDDLSGGQQQLINVVTAFGLYDTIAVNKFSILILDEIFEHLSSNNIEIVASILESRCSDKAIYLITHLSELVTAGSQTLEIRNLKGLTKILLD